MTREDGIRYYSENTPNDISDCIKMVERHIVMPSQATAYKIGMDKILQLRLKAKESLGDNFDIREFHDTILSNGALPLNFLELEIDEMIKRIQTGLYKNMKYFILFFLISSLFSQSPLKIITNNQSISDKKVPVIFLMHGYGDNERYFNKFIRNFDEDALIVSMRAPFKFL